MAAPAPQLQTGSGDSNSKSSLIVNPLSGMWSYTVTFTVPMFPGLSDHWPIRRCNTWLFDRPTNQIFCFIWYKNWKFPDKDQVLWFHETLIWRIKFLAMPILIIMSDINGREFLDFVAPLYFTINTPYPLSYTQYYEW